uniref:Uncharacterized protein n=1 Tax=Mycena chlorophos TaxID=658473 RepID=A0ABQ0LXA2_MYCCL|nr:predicted protein [Mycena chlorophos]
MPPARSSTRSSGPLTRSKSSLSGCRSTKATRSLDALTSEQNAFLLSLSSNNRRATGKRKSKKKCGGRLAKTSTDSDPADKPKDTLSPFTVEYLHGLRRILPRSACASLQPSLAGSAGPSSPSCPAPPHDNSGAPRPYTQYKEHKKPPPGPTLVIPGPPMWFVPTLMPVAFVPQPTPSRLDWESELELQSESEPESAEDHSAGDDSDSDDIQVDSRPINISDLEPRQIETTVYLDDQTSRGSCVSRGCGDDGLAANSPAAPIDNYDEVELPHWDPDVDATASGSKATDEVKEDNSEARSIDTIPNPSEPADEPRDSALPQDDGIQPTAIAPEMVPENLLQELEVAEPQDPWGWDWNVQEARATLASATDAWWDEAVGLWSGSGPFWDDPGAFTLVNEPPSSVLGDEQLQEDFGFGDSGLDPALRGFVDLFPEDGPMFENVEWR